MAHQRIKKAASVILAAAMISSCFAFPVFADEEEQVQEETAMEEQVIEEPEEQEIPEEQEVPEEPEEEGPEEEEDEPEDEPAVIIEPVSDEPIPELECIVTEVDAFPSRSIVPTYDASGDNDIEGLFSEIRSICSTWQGETSITIDVSSYNIARELSQTITNRFFYECPDCYPVIKMSFWSNGTILTKIDLTLDEYSLADKNIFDSKVSEIISGIDPLWSEPEKVLYLHDYIVTHCDYDVTKAKRSASDQWHRLYTAYDCLVLGSSVCEGYAKAFSVLCREAGIECYGVTSSSNNHAWNLVRIGGKFYYIDCTGDDPASTAELIVVYPGYCRHKYVLCGKSVFAGTTNHAGNDWLLNGGENCFDYDTGSEYDNSFSDASEISQDIRSRMVYIGDSKWVSYSQMYTSSGGSFKVYDFKTKSYSDFTVSGIYGTYNGICLAGYGGDLMLSNGDTIYRVTLSDDGLSGTASSLTFTNAYADSGDIYGIDVVGDVLYYSYGVTAKYGLYFSYGTASKASTSLPFVDVDYGRVTACSLTLDGSVGINFRIALPQDFLAGQPSVTVTNEETGDAMGYLLNGIKPQPDGSYLITYQVDADEMNDIIVLQLKNNGQTYALRSADGVDCTATGFRYSVGRYVEKAKEYYGTDTKLVSLLDNMYEYGKCSQLMFDHNADGVTYDSSRISDVTSATLASYTVDYYDQFADDGLNFCGMSLVLNTTVSVNLYFDASGIDYRDYRFIIGDDVTDVSKVGSYLKLTISDIPAAALGTVYKVNVYDDQGRAAVSINIMPMSYCSRVAVLHDQGSSIATDRLYDLVRLLYRYYQAADAYIK